MPSVTILVGMIGSGKSTIAKQMACDGAITVCDDAIVEAVHGGDYRLYRKYLKRLYKTTAISIATSALLLNLDVVIDRGVNITAKARRRWISLAHTMDATCRAIVIKPSWSPEEYADIRSRSNARGLSRDYWLNVAKAHLQRWENPTLAEGFDLVEFREQQRSCHLQRGNDGRAEKAEGTSSSD